MTAEEARLSVDREDMCIMFTRNLRAASDDGHTTVLSDIQDEAYDLGFARGKAQTRATKEE